MRGAVGAPVEDQARRAVEEFASGEVQHGHSAQPAGHVGGAASGGTLHGVLGRRVVAEELVVPLRHTAAAVGGDARVGLQPQSQVGGKGHFDGEGCRIGGKDGADGQAQRNDLSESAHRRVLLKETVGFRTLGTRGWLYCNIAPPPRVEHWGRFPANCAWFSSPSLPKSPPVERAIVACRCSEKASAKSRTRFLAALREDLFPRRWAKSHAKARRRRGRQKGRRGSPLWMLAKKVAAFRPFALSCEGPTKSTTTKQQRPTLPSAVWIRIMRRGALTDQTSIRISTTAWRLQSATRPANFPSSGTAA